MTARPGFEPIKTGRESCSSCHTTHAELEMFQMKPDIRVEEIPEQPTLVIRESANLASIPERMGKIFSEIMTFMGGKRIAPAGPHFAYWHNMNAESMSKGIFDMECGFPVAMPMEGEGRMRPGKLPGGKVITAMHIGPYEALAQTYEAIQAWYVFSSPKIARMISILVDEELQTNDLRQIEKQYL